MGGYLLITTLLPPPPLCPSVRFAGFERIFWKGGFGRGGMWSYVKLSVGLWFEIDDMSEKSKIQIQSLSRVRVS